MEKNWKTSNPKMDDFIMIVDVKRFSFNNLLQNFKLTKKY